MTRQPTLVFTLFIALGSFFFPGFAGADMKAASEALKHQDYATALRELEPLALQGDAAAQTNFGFMHSKGWGVPESDAEASKWYRMAAEQGQPVAQNNLGALMLAGQGGPKDEVVGLMWLKLAAENGYAAAIKAVEMQEKRMSPQEISLAERFAVLWKEKMALSK